MEIARMNYYFTGILIVMLTLLAFCAGPAYPRNEYLNSYPNECRTGEVDVSVSRRDYDYNNYDNSWNGSDTEEVRLTFRKYLGTDCKTSKENAQIKQQLELMKMCNKVNRNPSLAQNQNFALKNQNLGFLQLISFDFHSILGFLSLSSHAATQGLSTLLL